jgi:hypothetical protein
MMTNKPEGYLCICFCLVYPLIVVAHHLWDDVDGDREDDGAVVLSWDAINNNNRRDKRHKKYK